MGTCIRFDAIDHQGNREPQMDDRGGIPQTAYRDQTFETLMRSGGML